MGRSRDDERRIERMGWAEDEKAAYYHPVTGARITRRLWLRLVGRRGRAIERARGAI